MLSHSSLTGATELHARKLQATNVLATLARIRVTGTRSSGDNSALEQGLELLEDLVKGHQLFSDAPVTRQLVGEGFAFLVAARALNLAEKDKLDDCGIFLNRMRSTLTAIQNTESISSEQQEQLEHFLTEFARMLQSDINIGRAQNHLITTRL